MMYPPIFTISSFANLQPGGFPALLLFVSLHSYSVDFSDSATRFTRRVLIYLYFK